jgi:DNA-binding transcriptional LysR family regulator
VLPISRDLFSFRCDNDVAQVAAIEAGLGIGVMQTVLAKRNPELVGVMTEQISFKLEIWLGMHEDQRDQPAIRAVFDGLASGLSANFLDR